METLHGFQKKIETREFAIRNSWKADTQGYITNSSVRYDIDDPMARVREEFEQCLSECEMAKYNDGYLPIQAGRFGKTGVFIKRALRKLLKIILGWYLFPIYQRHSLFNGKILNAVALQRTIVNEQLNEKAELSRRLEEQKRMIEQLRAENSEAMCVLEKRFKRIENLPTDDEDFYHCFEEEFRGTRDEIKNRMEAYVLMLKERLPDWSKASFVDVGSGRGEWMDILKWNGAKDYVGVDLNERQNKIAESFGHRTVCGDCIQYLAALPDNSLDLITGFQIIEHLCMSDLMELLQQSYRTLKKGGMILFETQNPQNVIVGSYSFYIDVSHRRPLIPETMKFMASWSGFSQTDLIFVNTNPHLEEIRPKNAEVSLEKAFDDVLWRFYGPQDYALFAVK